MSTATLTSSDAVRTAFKWLGDEFILVQADMVRSARTSGSASKQQYERFRAIQTLLALTEDARRAAGP